MHLLVLSAFRRKSQFAKFEIEQVSMHLLVLSTFRLGGSIAKSQIWGLNAPSGAQCFPTDRRLCDEAYPDESQCTFWCSVLSDSETSPTCEAPCTVSMHLLVLSAFRLGHLGISDTRPFRLNAPSGAQCFPTGRIGFASSQSPDDCLNAPSGAQCFPTDEDGNLTQNPFDQVSMHLLVLSAFRH